MRGALIGALVADSLSLSTHYEYDATKIKQFYGSIDKYMAPGEKTGGQTHGVGWGARNYHDGNGRGPAKRAGEQTDYGDYNLLIAQHLANTSQNPHKLDLNELLPTWQKALKTWRAWMCTQTKQTLQQVQQGIPNSQLGGFSNAMAIRSAACLSYYDNEEDAVDCSRVAMFTHREQSALDGGEFFTRVAFRIIHNDLTPLEAIEQVTQTSSQFIQTKVQQALDKVKEATDPDSHLFKEEFVDDIALTSMARLWDVGRSEPIKVGKASPTEGTLPGSIYFILKYQNDLMAASKANASVGGDTASRAVAIGMVLGAYRGIESIPEQFGKGNLVEWDTAQGYLDQMPLIKSIKQEL